jgi:primase-polymerase (primpol)-like protein
MEELLELRHYIEQQRYPEALNLLAEMEEMSREDKLHKMYSFAELLVLHLIKQAAERRTTRSWDLSIRNAARQIARVNKRYKSRGTYFSASELREVLTEAYQPALERAALEAFEGRYDDVELGRQVERVSIEQKALALIVAYQKDQNG